ncbi:MAG: flagellar motor switch protein FliG [Rhodobacteraceae bacterium]|nr:flagellar motor switch protein FliG [Paracoccaceae bacterium]
MTLASPDRLDPVKAALSRREKAAVLVQILLSEGAKLSLEELPEDLQTDLANTLAALGPVDQATRDAVVEDFARELSGQSSPFGRGLSGALRLLEGTISPVLAQKLRAKAGLTGADNPWERITESPTEKLAPLLERESIEVAAVILSKLSVTKAAEILGQLPGERARRITYAVSQTSAVRPDAVRRIGQTLASELAIEPERAFESGPVERVGAILNSARGSVRDEVLVGLDETDAAFAEEVRQAIFTFANIPERIDPRDVPKIVRLVEQDVLARAIAAARGDLETAGEFLLGAISKRMAETIREEAGEITDLSEEDGEEAMGLVVAVIRQLEGEGEIHLVAGEA